MSFTEAKQFTLQQGSYEMPQWVRALLLQM